MNGKKIEEVPMNVYEKLANVQSALKAPKGQYNSFGKYKYRSCEDIVESVKPLLKANGLLLTLSDELVLIGDRFYVKATAEIIDTKDGGIVSVSAFAREEETKKGMDGSQVTGASSSYARKYALNGLFAIDDTKDSDATNTHGNETPTEAPKQEQKTGKTPRQMLIARLNELGIDVNAYAKANNLNGKTEPEVFQRLLKELENA
jgi:hypothetical protein